MKIPIRPNNSHNRLADQDKLYERESWHKLVVKIITWKDGSSQSTVRANYRITAAEWKTYSEHVIKNNTSRSEEKISSSLKETREIIYKNGGFEEDVILIT